MQDCMTKSANHPSYIMSKHDTKDANSVDLEEVAKSYSLGVRCLKFIYCIYVLFSAIKEYFLKHH